MSNIPRPVSALLLLGGIGIGGSLLPLLIFPLLTGEFEPGLLFIPLVMLLVTGTIILIRSDT